MQATRSPSERRVRAHALRMWREEGSPKGRMDDYLERARELEAMAAHPGAGLLANPMSEHAGAIPPAQPIEEAALEENLGEFPGRFSDQGDRSPTPMTRQKARRVLREG